MKRVSQKTIEVMTAVVILMLLYAVAINLEYLRNSQRYVVQAQSSDGGIEHYECLDMEAGITQEMQLEQNQQMTQVSREKMHFFNKWLTCAVL